MRISWWIYLLFAISFFFFSWGFADPNFLAVSPGIVRSILMPLITFFDLHRGIVTALYIVIISGIFLCYFFMLSDKHSVHFPAFKRWIISVAVIFVLSYPAFSFDIFNYVLTSRVMYQYRENPYITQPIEIQNEPMLRFSRAINKTALYGPVWLFISAIPYFFGFGSVWLTILAFKLLNLACIFILSLFIFRQTKSLWHVTFFALNPLVVIEVLGNAHNDIVMMTLAVAGVILWGSQSKWNKALGMTTIFISTLVKGATLVIVPALIFSKSHRFLVLIVYMLFGLFLITPMREELYPWYAVWFLPFVALTISKGRSYHQFFMLLSFVLLLRYIPYMYFRHYSEPVPFIRLMLTTIPLGVYALWQSIRLIHVSKALIVE